MVTRPLFREAYFDGFASDTGHGAEFCSEVSDFPDNRNRLKEGYNRFRSV